MHDLHQLDELQRLWDVSLSVGVLGNENADFILIPLDPLDSSVLPDAANKGFTYIGSLGIVKGRVDVRIEARAPVDYKAMVLAAAAFGELFRDHILSAGKGDAVDWLRELHSLPDSRPE